MNIAVVGTGYVGLVTGTCLADIGHQVTCIDIDEEKIAKLKRGESPIYEPGLEELLERNINNGNLTFTTDYKQGFKDKDVAYIAVGTPENEDGSANLTFVETVAKQIAETAQQDIIVVTKSTVPVGTNHRVLEILKENKKDNVHVSVVSNPEFLREGSAIYDTFNGDRIVIGADDQHAADTIEEINRPFNVSVYKTDVASAEMIKYASNAFLATKISFINEVANICERVGANVEDVAAGMGMDDRIGNKFLNAGIGYGGSCFPKDTKALIDIAKRVDYDFKILNQVVDVNTQQQRLLVDKVKDHFNGNLQGKTFGVLGLAFKPNTDDMREAASIVVTKELLDAGANVKAFDPIAMDNAKQFLDDRINYQNNTEDTIQNVDAILILTEWDEFKDLFNNEAFKAIQNPVVFDGRNIYSAEEVNSMTYYSVGR
ncbi:UDP-glucose dehydrogenase family protein [Alkalibacillus haloalkaliphilus]|uniref:UDP-glucose dehydrogenase family protein n=1 Tax=Alkalibacillus haloalkaliphilus TaxID=94136 RepID=UPI002936B51E|nr:UDP-glucose/GDP-mannose dehydrogenase family protein [Alkalibacillus haloalkaliphilus]MDV2583308.1 UDP-glucose/GDP-mannose dehydrogenase family protein [Alkalibacillus haloalkaliphilus]